MTKLIVVVDPNYGDRLETATHIAPVWVVESLHNEAACKRLWSAHPTSDHTEKGAITCYNVSDAEDRVANLLNVLPDLELHHGEFSAGFTLEVIGLKLTNSVICTLRELGFSSFSERPEGFHVRK
jgi:hypothetical protein